MERDRGHHAVIYFFLIVFIAFGCNSTRNDSDKHQVVFANISPEIITYDTFNFNKSVTGSKIFFSYHHPTRRRQLVFDTTTNELWVINRNNDTTIAEYSRTLWTNDRGTILKAYEYFTDRHSLDGEAVLYISPLLGMISDQSLVWKRGTCLKLYFNNDIDIHSLTYFLGLNYPKLE